jgi:tRNA threonylcarbamoyladenosine biosynthesis protein TsaE
MSNPELHVLLPDPVATDALGAAIARALSRARPRVLHLRGELGAGKTALVRSVLRSLGVGGLIRSPTYTLIETYACGDLTLVHVDLYRISGESAAEELGLRDWVGPDALMLIEWPERGGAAVPPADLTVMLSYAQQGRSVRLMAREPSGAAAQLLDELRNDTSLGAYLYNFA